MVIKEIEFKVLELINQIILNKQINPEQLNDDFTKMGIDSMEIIRFIVAVEEHYSIEFDDELLKYQISEENFPNNLNKIRKWGHSLDYLEKNTRHMFTNGIDKYNKNSREPLKKLSLNTLTVMSKKRFQIRKKALHMRLRQEV